MGAIRTETAAEKWLPRPGELLEFGPVDRCRAAATRAPVSTVPASFLQESHIIRCMERRRSGTAPSPGLVLVFEMGGRLDRLALQHAFRAFLLRHETLMCWFEPTADSDEPALIRHVVPADDIEFSTESRGRFESGAEIRDLLLPEFKTKPNALRWPGFINAVIDHGDDGFTVIFAVDHAHSDALSMPPAFFDLYLLYQAYHDDVEPALPPAGSFVEFTRAEHALLAHGDQSPKVGRFRDLLLESAAHFQPVPVELGLAPGETAASVHLKIDLLDNLESDVFATTCARHNGTFSSGLVTALALAELELAGHRHFTGLSVYSTRKGGAHMMSQGWFINLLPMYFEVGAKACFSDLIGVAARAYDTVKPLADVPVHGAIEVANQSPDITVPPTSQWHQISYADTRRVIETMQLPPDVSISILGSRNQLAGLTPFWFVRDLDHTSVSIRFPDTPAARASVTRLLEQVRTVIRAVAKTGDYVAAAALSSVAG